MSEGELAPVHVALLDRVAAVLARSETDLAAYLPTLAVLAALSRHAVPRAGGDPDLCRLFGNLGDRIDPGDRLRAGHPLALVSIDRDGRGDVPADTWFVAHGVWSCAAPLPFDRNLRPIFLAFGLKDGEPIAAEALATLARCAPIGCRDRETMRVLTNAGVAAFFSGPITTLLDLIAPPGPREGEATCLIAAAPSPEPAEGDVRVLDLADPAAPWRPLETNLRLLLDELDNWSRECSLMVTDSIDVAFAARAFGLRVALRPARAAAPEFEGFAETSDGSWAALAEAMREKLASLFGTILSGAAEDEVRTRWRTLCAADVEAARAEIAALTPGEAQTPAFDIAGAVAAIGAGAVSLPAIRAPAGEVIDVALACDGNQKSHLPVALLSLVRASARPVRAWILARDLGEEEVRRLHAALPEVALEILPCDRCDYGPIRRIASHISISTMDRLLLPMLLPAVERLVYVDLDTITLGDVAVLADLDLGGALLAARPNITPQNRIVRQIAHRIAMRLDHDRARALRLSIAARMPRDVPAFNAGLLVLDLAALRRAGFTHEAIAFVEQYGMNDQDVLNCLAGHARADLPPGWNVFPAAELAADPKLVHWIGPMKPWGTDYVPRRDLWEDARQAWETRVRALDD